jgi:WD40 repeat protein
MTVSADGRTVVSAAGVDGTVRVWDLMRSAALRKLTGHVRRGQAVAVSADRRAAVSSGYGEALVWDLDKTDTPRELTRPDGLLYAVAVSADGRTAAASAVGARPENQAGMRNGQIPDSSPPFRAFP